MRRKYPQGGVAGLALPRRPGGGEEGASEAPEEGGPGAKRLLPDRTVAAHNRATEKLVTFIVSQRLADKHLLVRSCAPDHAFWLL